MPTYPDAEKVAEVRHRLRAFPPLVFAGAPVVSVFVAMLYNPPREAPSPLFFVGILMAAAGAFLVLSNRPQ